MRVCVTFSAGSLEHGAALPGTTTTGIIFVYRTAVFSAEHFAVIAVDFDWFCLAERIRRITTSDGVKNNRLE